MTRSALRRLAALILIACLASGPPASAQTSPAVPRLAVVFVIDGLPMRQLLSLRDQFVPDGFERFLRHGTWFAQAHYGHAYTVTCVGHATLLTGADPARTGIVGNEWRDPATGQPRYCADDPSARYIGHATNPLDGTSPRRLRVPTVGDVLRERNPASKVIAVSGKDRGAIMTAGHRGQAYMYMSQTGRFASSSYYMQAHPAWVDAFNAARPADRYFRERWAPLLPQAAYARSLPDGQPWQPRGIGLPLALSSPADDAPGPRFYSNLLATPFGDALTLDFARAAVRGEGLGQDDSPDILAVSLSSHDYVNHGFSAESRMSHDHLLQVDRLLQGFFADLDRAVGRGRYVAVLSADHGFMPNPQYLASQGQAAGRVDVRAMLARLNDAVQSAHGAGAWVSLSGNSIVIDRQQAVRAGLDVDAAARTVQAALRREPGIEAAWTRHELSQAEPPPGAPPALFKAMQRSFHPQESGDVLYALQANWMLGGGVATHGSVHPYDTHVPLLWWGPPWVAAARIDERVDLTDLAPTLASLLGVPAPAASQGRAWKLDPRR